MKAFESIKLGLVAAACLGGSTLGAVMRRAPNGFVGTNGQSFTLDGGVFTVVGSNSYWVGLTGLSTEEMDQTFSDIAGAGATTVRTWGFNDVTAPESTAYYQLWTNGTAAVNYGADGLENFDNVVAAAKANGLRLIVTLTNNWSDYGGMDVYLEQLLGPSTDHDYFYTNPTVIAAYERYVDAFVSRYVDEPTILAWELANEPRCAGTPGTSSGTCNTTTITDWAQTVSAYIKSIDSNHLVAIGDEGFFNDPGNSLFPYQGTEGIDFNANMQIETLDFGTAHLYPVSWGQTSDPTGFGVQWITDHATSQKTYNKPVIIEEFGVTTNMTGTYQDWWNTMLAQDLTGDLIWQAGSNLSSGPTPNDGFTIYLNNPVYAMEADYAADLKARNA